MRAWVLITRPRDETTALAEALADCSFDLLGYPVLREMPTDDEDGWRQVHDWCNRLAALFLTSPRAPRHFRRAGEREGLWPRLASLPADAVGATTALACRQASLEVRHVGTAGGTSLATRVAQELHPGEAVLHPTSRHRREEAYAVITRAGADVLSLVVYDMQESDRGSLPVLPETSPAAVLLTSPRAAAAYLRAAPSRVLSAPHFALGMSTAETAAQLGLASRKLPRPDPMLLVEELCQT